MHLPVDSPPGRGTIAVILFVTLLIVAVGGSNAYGHVNYVLSPEERKQVLQSNPLQSEINTLAPLFFILFVSLALAQFLGAKLQDHKLIKEGVLLIEGGKQHGLSIVRIASGGFLLASGLSDTYFSPQLGLHLDSSLSPIFLLETITGILLVAGVLTRLASLIFLFLSAGFGT